MALASEEEEPKSDIVDVDQTSDDEPKVIPVESEVRVEQSEHDVEIAISRGIEGDAVENGNSDVPQINVGGEEVKDDVLECQLVENGIADFIDKPSRRITRSALKSKEAMLVDSKNEVVVENEVVNAVVTPLNTSAKKREKKVVLKRFPSKLKELLETGLLEGLPVRYLRGEKVRGKSEKGLHGVIKGTGILCYCDSCDGNKVVTPNQFELHAGSANKHPPEYIFLDNGATIRDVLNACKSAPLDKLEENIVHVIGSIPETGNGKRMLLCDSCVVLEESQQSSAQLSDISDRVPLSVSASKSSDRVSQGNLSRSKGQGRDLRMHKLVFEEDVLPDGTALAYYARGQKLLEGYKKGAGIFCFCCDTEVSPSQFEAHAGWASRRKPYLHIYTSNGVSLHELSIGLSKQRKFSADENDDLCSICADGGELLLCDTCPRAFHTECVFLPSIPRGTWYCRYCQNTFQKEKCVEHNVNAVAAGRVAGVDPIDEISKRCIRIVGSLDVEVGGCVLCRGHDFSKSVFGPRTVILCDQCEKEFHVGCMKEHKMASLKELPKEKWFCCRDCNNIHSTLQKLVVDGEEKLPDSLLNIIKKKNEDKGFEGSSDFDIRWRLLYGKSASEDTRALFSNAVAIFHSVFFYVVEALVYAIGDFLNFLQKELEGPRFWRHVFSSVVSAGIFRVFGKEFAELPLVATVSDRQGQGYFQSLFSCIENLLGSLNVRDLVLPAAEEAESIWLKKFGFEKIPPDQARSPDDGISRNFNVAQVCVQVVKYQQAQHG
ncbi:hypothetical protein RJ639_044601 [Escallonia herrerae]|uniref:PHD-type domain-containing protein n=1 Tax=Escallonia herrerae TaxID=1293975 RepID=A0AA88WCG6_9ASTE|nr:hypothetical protein RJ639_044601 [Escallonia herrerae]